MKQKIALQFRAGEAIIGTIVGVGLFGLPFAFVQAGFFVGLAFLLGLGVVMTVMLLMMAEVSFQTPGRHRLAGYMKNYFGRKWGIFMAFVMLGASWGGIVAYVLIGGDFMYSLLGSSIGGSLFAYRAFFLGVGFLISMNGLKLVSRAESYLVAGLIIVVSVIIFRGVIDVDYSNLMVVNSSKWLVPYGVVLFSLSGFGVVPELKDILGRHYGRIKVILPISMAIIVLIYGLFAFVVTGVTGGATTPEAIVGLGGVMGEWVLIVGSILGFLAVATSFLITAISLQDMLEFDFGYSRLLAWFLTLSVPTVIFLMGMNDFIKVIGFTGSVFGGLIGLSVVMMYLRMTRRNCSIVYKCVPIPRGVVYLLGSVFFVGIVIELVRTFISKFL